MGKDKLILSWTLCVLLTLPLTFPALMALVGHARITPRRKRKGGKWQAIAIRDTLWLAGERNTRNVCHCGAEGQLSSNQR